MEKLKKLGGKMNDIILQLNKIKSLKAELLEVCEAWDLTTEEKVSALQMCIKNIEEIYTVYPENDQPSFRTS
jgi:hypothetical protein